MAPHPADELLVLWLDGELEPAEADALRKHLDGCTDCQRRHAAYRRLSEDIVSLHKMTEAAPRRRRNIWWWPAAAAAVLVAAFWARPPARPVEALPPLAAVTIPAPPPPAPAQPRAQKAPAARTEAQPAREFIPLPFSDHTLPMADSPVVRVSLPVENLRLASFRISPELEGQRVLADVVLGMDGLPRAIRLVESLRAED